MKKLLVLVLLVSMVLGSLLVAFGNVTAVSDGGSSCKHSYSVREEEVWTSVTHKFIHTTPGLNLLIPMDCSQNASKFYNVYTCSKCNHSYRTYNRTWAWGSHSNTLCPGN